MACPRASSPKIGAAPNRRGTSVTFHPDAEIFGSLKLKPARLFAMARSKAYLFLWRRNPLENRANRRRRHPARGHLPLPGVAWLTTSQKSWAAQPPTRKTPSLAQCPSRSSTAPARSNGRSTGPRRATASSSRYCNTVPTPKAARMRPASGPPSSRASAPTANLSATRRPRKSPAKI